MTSATDFVLDEPYLVFVACWGSGKTLLMITKAKELNALGEKVLMLVFLNGKEIEEGQKSLLILDLEEKLKEYQNVTVKGVRYMELTMMQWKVLAGLGDNGLASVICYCLNFQQELNRDGNPIPKLISPKEITGKTKLYNRVCGN